MKKCSKCRDWKSHGEFGKQAAAKNGLRSQCKKCDAADARKRYVNNPERVLAAASREAERLESLHAKKCSGCKDRKTFDQFGKHTASKDGLKSRCKECRNADGREYAAAHRDKNNARSRKWETDNPVRARATKRKSNAKNSDKIVAYNRNYAAANREGLKSYQRERYAEDTVYKLTQILRSRLTAAIRNKSKRGSAVKLLGCSIEDAMIHLENQFAEGMSWANHSLRGWHIDHIVPLSAFNLEDPTELAAACHYTNLQPLWATDNISKGGNRGQRRGITT